MCNFFGFKSNDTSQGVIITIVTNKNYIIMLYIIFE